MSVLYNKMPAFVVVKKHYIAMGTIVFVMLFLFNSRPSFQCLSVTTSSPVKEEVPTIYGITPTYARLVQKADLTRLAQTLMHVKNFHWIIIEDSLNKTVLVENFLNEIRNELKSTHLFAKTVKTKPSTASGVEQRNAALQWLRRNLVTPDSQNGIVYFMDDDNTYSLKVFDEVRKVKKVGIWPVGLVGAMRVEMPLVKNGKVTGFNAIWKPTRPFPIDMAGFAIHVKLILKHPEAVFSRTVQSGYQETEILKYVTTVKDLEPMADNCTKVYVWHTRTTKPSIKPSNKLAIKPPDDSHIEV